MNALLSWQLWKIFFIQVCNSFFPAELILMFFSLKSLKNIFISRSLRILITFIGVDLGIRILVFFAGAGYSERYLLVWTISAGVIFATAGFNPVVDGLHFIIKSFTSYNIHRNFIIVVILLIIAIGYSLKALRLRHDKPWLQAVGKIIGGHHTTNKRVLIYTNYLDRRWGYYANTEFVYDLGWYFNNDLKAKEQRRRIKKFSTKISKLKQEDIFIIIRLNYHNNSNSIDKSIKQLLNMKLLKQLTDDKHRKINLYQFIK